MRQYIPLLHSTRLFAGIEPDELLAMLTCLGAVVVSVRRGAPILKAGDRVEHLGMVIEGHMHILREDLEGNQTLLAAVGPGELFAETLCCAGVAESPVSVRADTAGKVLRFPFARIMGVCSNTCAFHTQLIANMLRVIAEKNLYLQRRLELLAKKSLRERLLHYLEDRAPGRGVEFAIPLNREQLAAFLCADRSALSRVLSQMQEEGVLTYRRNRFRIE